MKSKFVRTAVVFILAASVVARSVSPGDGVLMGFTAAGSKDQRELEARFDASLKADNLKSWMKRLAARPHFTGSAAGKANAEFMAEQFRSWGFDTRIESFDVLFPTPKTRLVEMTAPEKFTQRQDRYLALRRGMARYQAKGRRRTRCDRLYHLL